MYELFVLGELMDQPLHGYLLRDIIARAFASGRQISWGSLYPLIRRLEKSGFIAPHGPSAEAGTRRKAYAITEKGRAHFYELMLREEMFGSDYPDLFTVKFVNFDQITPEQRLAILQHYQGYLHDQQEQLADSRKLVEGIAEIPGTEQTLILRVIERQQRLNETEAAWLERQLAESSKDL